jgi:hypothetical protein
MNWLIRLIHILLARHAMSINTRDIKQMTNIINMMLHDDDAVPEETRELIDAATSRIDEARKKNDNLAEIIERLKNNDESWLLDKLAKEGLL